MLNHYFIIGLLLDHTARMVVIASFSPTYLFGRDLKDMPELQLMFNRHRKYMLYLLSLYVIGWGFTQYQSVFLGLILGTTISLYNHWLMVRRTKRFGEAIETGGKFRSFGTVTRMVAAVLAVMVATKYPEYFNFLCVILGLVTSYVVIMIDFIIHHIIQSHK